MAAERTSTPIGPAEADRLFAVLAGARGLGVAVSGGADSVALMRLVADWRDRTCPTATVVVFTVDHGLRPDSASEAAGVAGWARSCGLTHETLVWDGRKPASGIQSAAREARYRLLFEACTRHRLSHLVTAHHLDDQAETLLLRLARGSGVDGLAAMADETPLGDLTLARPLLDVPKTRLVATLTARGQDWIEDPSNDDARFARARLRKLMPELAGEGMTAQRLADTARRMRRARAALESAAADLHRAAVSEDAAGFCRLDRRMLAAAPEEVGLRVLARLLMGIGGLDYPPRLDRLERLYDGLVGDGARSGRFAATLSGCRVVVAGETVSICRESGRAGLPVDRLESAGPLVWDRRFRVEAGTGKRCLTVRALGAQGVTLVRNGSVLRDIPVVAARATPGVFDGETLVAAPLVEAAPGPYSPAGYRMAFIGGCRFADFTDKFTPNYDWMG